MLHTTSPLKGPLPSFKCTTASPFSPPPSIDLAKPKKAKKPKKKSQLTDLEKLGLVESLCLPDGPKPREPQILTFLHYVTLHV